jgi:hypothetical protein
MTGVANAVATIEIKIMAARVIEDLIAFSTHE